MQAPLPSNFAFNDTANVKHSPKGCYVWNQSQGQSDCTGPDWFSGASKRQFHMCACTESYCGLHVVPCPPSAAGQISFNWQTKQNIALMQI